jgi:hypothetical protein
MKWIYHTNKLSKYFLFNFSTSPSSLGRDKLLGKIITMVLSKIFVP